MLPAKIYTFSSINYFKQYIEQKHNLSKCGSYEESYESVKIKITLTHGNVIAYVDNFVKKDCIKKIISYLTSKYGRYTIVKREVMGYVIPEKYTFHNGGITYLRERKNRDGETTVTPVLISNRWLFVKSRVYSQYHDIFQYEVESYDPVSKKNKIELCSAEELGKWALCISFLMNSLAVITEEDYKKEIVSFFNKFLLENIDRLGKKSTIPRMGWNDSMTEFFPYSDKLHFDFTGDKSKYLKNTIKGFEPRGSKSNFINTMREFTNDNFDADFIISTMFAAPLLKLIGIRSFAINFFGESGSLKSLASKIAVACFGDPARLSSSGNHTKLVLIEKISKFHNLAFYIDEITEACMDIYGVGNETGRHRLSKAGAIQESVNWRTIMYCTSEASMARENNKAGEVNRLLCIPVDCTPPGIDSNTLQKEEYARNLYLFIEHNYGLLGETYIKNIIKIRNNISKFYDTIACSIFDNSKNKQHVQMISAIVLGNYLYRSIFYGIDDIDYSISLGKMYVSKIAKAKDLDPVQKMYECILEYYSINKAAFVVDREVQKANYCYGRVYNNKVYFILNPLKEYLEKNGFNWNGRKALIDKGYLEYKQAKISGENGKRLILDLDTQYECDEREAIEKYDGLPIE
jgi:hypothetical protein